MRPNVPVVAALVGLVATPAFVLAIVPGAGELAIAIATVVLGVLAVGGAAIGPGWARGGALIGPAAGVAFVSRLVTDRAIAAPFTGHDDHGAIAAGAAVIALAVVGAYLGERAIAERLPQAAIAVAAGVVAAGAVAIGASGLVRGEAPSGRERLESIAPAHELPAWIEDATQREPLGDGLAIERRCTGELCELVVAIEHAGGVELGSRRILGDALDRAPLAVVVLPEIVAIVPRTHARTLDWSRAMAFRRATAQADDIAAGDLGASVRPPIEWRVAQALGVVLGLAALVLARRARAAQRRIRGGLDATADADGVLRLEDGSMGRAPAALAPGTYVVTALDRSAPSYREDGIATVRSWIAGSRGANARALGERIAGLELAAIGAIAITHAPLVAAWTAGSYAVLGG